MKNKNLRKVILSLFSLIIFQINIQAQCEASTAEADIEGDNVIAKLQVGGDLWWDGSEGQYLFPKPPEGIPELGVSPIKVGGIWFGGYGPDGELKVAAQTDGRQDGLTDYWPGDSDEQLECFKYDRFWSMTANAISVHLADYNDNGVIDGPVLESILAWPAQGNPYSLETNGFEIPFDFTNRHAPFVDMNGDNIYDPMDGDHPDINCATDAVWWKFNDFAGTHTQSGGGATGVQMEVLAYTYQSLNIAIENTTFYEVHIKKLEGEPLDSVYMGLWLDFDLGCPFDDMIGCDTSRNMAYVYNQDNVDGLSSCSDCNGYNTYCEEIPMLGVKMLNGPLGGRMFINGIDGSDGLRNPLVGEVADTIIEMGMTSFMYYNEGANSPFPDVPSLSNGSPEQFYNLMTGTWPDGTPLTKGGSGYNPGSTDYTNFAFPSAPTDPDGWSMCKENFDGGNRKVLMGFGPLHFVGTGNVTRLTFAVFGVENVAHPCPDLSALNEAADYAQLYADRESQADINGCGSFFPTSTEVISAESSEVVFQPNPMEQEGQLILKNENQFIEEVEIYSIEGKGVFSIKNINAQSVDINRGGLNSGMYFYVLKTNEANLYSGKFIVL